MTWEGRNTYPETTYAFLCLASAPGVFLILCLPLKEIFVLLYELTSTCSDVNLARKGKFLEGISSTWADL